MKEFILLASIDVSEEVGRNAQCTQQTRATVAMTAAVALGAL